MKSGGKTGSDVYVRGLWTRNTISKLWRDLGANGQIFTTASRNISAFTTSESTADPRV